MIEKLCRTVLVLAIIALGIAPAWAGTLDGRVVGITDGDTLTLLTPEHEQVRIRLAEIDTPESGQPYGNRARQALSDLAFGREAIVAVRDTDRYGRIVGRVVVGGVDVNAELVRQGAAWVYRRYSSDPELLAIEAAAREAGRGLWGLPETERQPPWEWRHAGPTGGIPPVVAQSDGQFRCEGKRTCGQMTSCAEARFYLEQCGVSRLDGDKDGVPCESIC